MDLDLFWHGELQSLCAACHSMRKQSEERGDATTSKGAMLLVSHSFTW